MTVEAFAPSPVYVIAGTGPYEVTHPYRAGALRVVVWRNGIRTELTSLDFTVSPAEAEETGTVTLSASAAATHAGGSLFIARETAPEQGWEGTTSRERGLEAQLDWLTQGVQDAGGMFGRTLRVPLGDTANLELPPALARALRTLMFDATGRPTVGTVAATELLVSAYVETLLAAADPAALVNLFKDGFATAGTVTFQTLVSAFSRVTHPTEPIFDLQETGAPDAIERTRFRRSGSSLIIGKANASGGDVSDDLVFTYAPDGSGANGITLRLLQRAQNYGLNWNYDGFNERVSLIPTWTSGFPSALGRSTNRWTEAWLVNAPNVSSDARLKEDFADYTEADLAAARKIRGKSFRLKESGRSSSGYVAQEIIDAFVEAGADAARPFELGLVAEGEDGFLGVHYELVNALILTAILEALEGLA